MMDFYLVGDNQREKVESTIEFSEGSMVLCDPGVNVCSSSILEMMQIEVLQNGAFSCAPDINSSPSWGFGKYGVPFVPGLTRVYKEFLDCPLNQEMVISHPPDPQNKRYVETWITDFPVTQVPFSVIPDSESPWALIEGADKVSLKPIIYPELIQTLPLPVGGEDILRHTIEQHGGVYKVNNAWKSISMSESGEKVIAFGGSKAVVYEWGGAGYSQALIHDLGAVDNASVQGNYAIVTYTDVTAKIAYYTKSGTWGLTGTYDWAYPGKRVTLRDSFILVDGYSTTAVTLNKSDRSVYFTADSENFLAAIPMEYPRYQADNYEVFGYDDVRIMFGGIPKTIIAYTRFTYDTAYLNIFDFHPYKPPWEEDIRIDGEFILNNPLSFLKHPYGSGFDQGIVVRTEYGELFPFSYLENEYNASFDWMLPFENEGYIFDEYLVGVGRKYITGIGYEYRYGVHKASGPQELHTLYSYTESEHKKFPGVFHPVKYPYYITNDEAGNLLLLKPEPNHFNEVEASEVAIQAQLPANTFRITSFQSDYNNEGTLKLLISLDGVTYYKWNGSTWVIEDDVSSGSLYSDFLAGCEVGFPVALQTERVYIKLYFFTSSIRVSPIINASNTFIGVQTLSEGVPSVLCDDSSVEVTFSSDTETTVKSLKNGRYAFSSQVCLIAPEYTAGLDVE